MAKEENWPRWPATYDRPLSLVDIRVKLNVDRLFHLLHAPGSEYVAHSQEVRGNKDYVETPWVLDMGELADAELTPPPPHSKAPQIDVKNFEGRVRKTSCSSFGMGMKFKTEELQRCVKGVKGKFFEMEVCVATTATYGDKFRGVCRHRFQAEDPEWSTWKAEFALVYIHPVNGLLKRAIEKGSASGLAKNFATLVEILGTYAEVKDPTKEVALHKATAQPSQTVLAPASSSDAWLGGLLNSSLVQTFEPLATSIGLPAGRGKLISGSILAAGMAIAVLLLVLEGILDSSAWVLQLFKSTPVQISLPANIVTIISSLLLFKSAQVAIVYAAVGIRKAAASARRYWGVQRPSGTSTAGEGDSEIPTAGIRFDGFNAALENASAAISSAEHDLRQASSQAHAILAPNSAARTQLRSSVKGFQKLMSDTWSAGRKAVASGALSPDRAVSPPPMRPSSSPPPQRDITNRSPKADSGDEAVVVSDARSPADDARKSKRTSRRGATRSRSPTKDADHALQARAVELSALGPKALSFTSQTSSQQAAEDSGVVEGEVFENERFLPFRGWGHEWPGHLLPTDRVGHWSLRGDRPSGAESMDFHRVAPPLPQGWQWLDEDWHIDMTGHEEACVDNEGWYYAVDFNWLKHPPAPGSGRFKRVRDYVRRRRWVRTRMRDDNAALAGSTLRQLATMSSLPPPLLPLAELLGDSADVSALKSLAAQDMSADKDAQQHSDGCVSLRASGSGEHSRPSRAGSTNLDFSSGQAGSQLPTPRLMYSTSRGLSLQESGVELSDMAVRVQLAVSETSDKPVEVCIAKKQDVTLPDSTAGQAAGNLLRSGPFMQSAASTSASGEEPHIAALPKPVIASQHLATGQQAVKPSEISTGSSAFAGMAASGAESPDPPRGNTLGTQQGTALTSERPGMPEHGSSSQHGPMAEAHQAAMTIAASLQPSPMTPGTPSQGIISAEQRSSKFHANIAAEGSQGIIAGGVPRMERLVEQRVRASLEPSDSSSFAGVRKTAETEVSRETTPDALLIAPAAESSDSDVQEAVSHSNAADETMPTSEIEKAQDAGVVSHAGSSPSKPPTPSSQGPASSSERPVAQHKTADSASRNATGPAKQGVDAHAMRTGSTGAADGPNVGLVKPTLKGLSVPKPPTGGSKLSSAVVSPTASSMQPDALLDQAAGHAGAASDHEALSPSAMSDSSDLGGMFQHPHAGHVDWNELGKRSTRLAALAGEGLRKGLRDIQQHTARQTAGKRESEGRREPEGSGVQESAAAVHAQAETNTKRPDIPQRDPSSSNFLQSLKARGEQSLNAARSALSPDAGRPHEAQMERAPSHGKEGQPGLGPSVRGMFSDLKRTMERVGVSPLIQSASTIGRRESSSSLKDYAVTEPTPEKQPQQQPVISDTPAQPISEAAHEQPLEEQSKSISDPPSIQSSEHGDSTPEVLSADEWGDFDFDHHDH